MSDQPDRINTQRRNFLGRAALTAVALPMVSQAHASEAAPTVLQTSHAAIEPFFGQHQGGIATTMQRNTYFMAFDVTSSERSELVKLLKEWTMAASRMTQQAARMESQSDPDQPPADSGASLGLSPARMTITFGFGSTLFEKNGLDRFGLAKQRPVALADLPRFAGDQLILERSGGDLSVQACGDDAQVLETAMRKMVSLAQGVAQIRWAQTGFTGAYQANQTPRNQMGFKDGTINVPTGNPSQMYQFVWVGNEGPAWMRDGTYMVIRPIRIALEHWDKMKLGFQEQTVGRHKLSGAPIGKTHEFDKRDLEATDQEGNLLIAENSHVRLAAAESNDGAQILRRAFNYDNGVTQIAERWPPWRQLVTFDAGLLFQCYQRDPRSGFTKMFEKMAKFDMLNQFTSHVGSALFAIPPGVQPGEFIGQGLFT